MNTPAPGATWLEGADWPDLEAARRAYRKRGGEAPDAVFDAAWSTCAAAVHAADARRAPPAWQPTLDALALPWPPPASGEHPVAVASVPDDTTLASIALDRAPAAGDDAPAALLGPWSETLDVHDPAGRTAWLAVVASAAFVVAPEEERTPARAWLRDFWVRKARAQDERDALRAVQHTPLVPWRLQAADGGFWVEPCLPVRAGWVPGVPLPLDGVVGVDGPPCDGGLLLARLVPVEDGWAVRCALSLPEVPPARALDGWFARMALPQVFATPSLELEDLLRRGGHRLVANAHRWWWAERAVRGSSSGAAARRT